MTALKARGDDAELVDAKAVGLPMLDRMYKEHAPGTAPPAMETLARRIEAADAFVFVVGEYNWSVQPGLKNLTDHFLEEWYWRPAAILSYSTARAARHTRGIWPGAASSRRWAWSSSRARSPSAASRDALDEHVAPQGSGGAALAKGFPRFADDLAWWTEAALAQRARKAPPY